MSKHGKGIDQFEFLIIDGQRDWVVIGQSKISNYAIVLAQFQSFIPGIHSPDTGGFGKIVHKSNKSTISAPEIEDVKILHFSTKALSEIRPYA